MTKAEALYKYFNDFGLQAYPSNNVPEGVAYPWLTYEANIGNAQDPSLSSVIQLWYHTDSEALPNNMAEAIAKAIGLGGNAIPYDSGMIWIKCGTPWCIPVDTGDKSVKCRQLNIELEYM